MSGLVRLPRIYRWLLMAGVAALCVVMGALFTLALPWLFQTAVRTALQPPPTIRMTAQLLRSEDLMFMVTNRIVTQIMVQQDQDSLLAGSREGVLIATVSMYYGVDMSKVTDRDIDEQAGRIVITLPAPAMLDFAIDPDFKIITKRSGVNVVLDWVYGHNLEKELRSQIKTAALKFAHDHDLLPSAASVLARLNQTADMLSGKVGKPVVFAFAQFGQTSAVTQPATRASTR